MNQVRFDAISRSLGAPASRRGLGRILTGGGLGALLGAALHALQTTDATAARNKNRGKNGKKRNGKKRNRKRVVLNQFGCIEVGKACRGDSTLCCSGICQRGARFSRQRDNSRCAAHNTGTCSQEAEGLCTVSDPTLALCDNRTDCRCLRTTAGSNICGELFLPGGSQCAACQRDADCVAMGLPAGTACAPVSAGRCAGTCATGMACFVPCGTTPPGP